MIILPMKEYIELHDSELASISFNDGSTIVSLQPAYIHRCEGRPGIDAGTGWLQNATLTFDGSSPFLYPAHLPETVSDGSLRIDSAIYPNVIPANGLFGRAIELSILLTSAGTFTVCGQRLSIELHGEAVFVENFTP